jgi:hypothetical protein
MERFGSRISLMESSVSSRSKWSLSLTRPIHIRNGPILRTLKDAADYALAKPKGDEAWKRVAEAVIDAAQSGKVDAVTAAIERVLWHRGMWAFELSICRNGSRERAKRCWRSQPYCGTHYEIR